MSEPECTLPPDPEAPYLNQIRRLNEERQQMEASNRWRLLESQTPAHDIGALRRKVSRGSRWFNPLLKWRTPNKVLKIAGGVRLKQAVASHNFFAPVKICYLTFYGFIIIMFPCCLLAYLRAHFHYRCALRCVALRGER